MAESHSEVSSQATNRDALLFRKPKRITVTVPDQIYRTLLERSTREGLLHLQSGCLSSGTGCSQ